MDSAEQTLHEAVAQAQYDNNNGYAKDPEPEWAEADPYTKEWALEQAEIAVRVCMDTAIRHVDLAVTDCANDYRRFNPESMEAQVADRARSVALAVLVGLRDGSEG